MLNPVAQLPSPKRRIARGGPELCSIEVDLLVVTPILGGGAATRQLDVVDVIRVPTVRGHLRFWWRAVRAAETPQALFKAESGLWGCAATDDGGRSLVDIRITVGETGKIDPDQILLYDSRDRKATRGAYALWPARGDRNNQSAPRRSAGTRFRLELLAPKKFEPELRDAVRAWVLFGGYGSRTRRGLGSLTVTRDTKAWLPVRPTREEFRRLFDGDIFASPGQDAESAPWLGGAALQVGRAEQEAENAWTTALDWLKEFRQGHRGDRGDRAREPGEGKPQPNRPSISNWPEADKIRHLTGKTKAHPPRHNAVPAWPRAGFGLPIIGRFQNKGRAGEYLDEPGAFELRWCSSKGEHDRLASPLILKALPLADGTFVPCALWLTRGFPPGASVVLAQERAVHPQSSAPFDRLVAAGDTPQFSALADKPSLRQAFLEWLHKDYSTSRVAP